MKTIAIVGMVLSAAGLAFGIVMLFRNQWVYNHRMKAIASSDYDRLPSYDEMMRRWWVWDINKFYGRKP